MKKANEIMCKKLVTLNPTVSVTEVAKIMAFKNIKKWGLTEDCSVVEIVTARDIVDAHQIKMI